MRNVAYEPCIPTRGTQVPAGPDWIHEIKHDGYRLIVVRDGARVRLFTREPPSSASSTRPAKTNTADGEC